MEDCDELLINALVKLRSRLVKRRQQEELRRERCQQRRILMRDKNRRKRHRKHCDKLMIKSLLQRFDKLEEQFISMKNDSHEEWKQLNDRLDGIEERIEKFANNGRTSRESDSSHLLNSEDQHKGATNELTDSLVNQLEISEEVVNNQNNFDEGMLAAVESQQQGIQRISSIVISLYLKACSLLTSFKSFVERISSIVIFLYLKVCSLLTLFKSFIILIYEYLLYHFTSPDGSVMVCRIVKGIVLYYFLVFVLLIYNLVNQPPDISLVDQVVYFAAFLLVSVLYLLIIVMIGGMFTSYYFQLRESGCSDQDIIFYFSLCIGFIVLILISTDSDRHTAQNKRSSKLSSQHSGDI